MVAPAALIGLPLAAAFVLGAVVSPPDAVATEAIAQDLPSSAPKRAVIETALDALHGVDGMFEVAHTVGEWVSRPEIQAWLGGLG